MLPIQIELPPDFLEEEVRCGYTVSVQMKKTWAVELDLLSQFQKVCRRHGLRYAAGGGTLLGAVRHRGFIPWDDDLDLHMPREDYDRLMGMAREFPEPYFLQSCLAHTDKKLVRTHARLRNSLTTGFQESDRYLDINLGIFIDIFPLDGISDSPAKDFRQRCANDFYCRLLELYRFSTDANPRLPWRRKLKKAAGKLLYPPLDKDKIWARYDRNLKKYSVAGTRLWGNRTIFFSAKDTRSPLEDWLECTEEPFEFLTIPVPVKYDELLRLSYGNYMEIPENKNGSLHGRLVLAPETPYSTFDVRISAL